MTTMRGRLVPVIKLMWLLPAGGAPLVNHALIRILSVFIQLEAAKSKCTLAPHMCDRSSRVATRYAFASIWLGPFAGEGCLSTAAPFNRETI
jgi:hypothetical protein